MLLPRTKAGYVAVAGNLGSLVMKKQDRGKERGNIGERNVIVEYHGGRHSRQPREGDQVQEDRLANFWFSFSTLSRH